MKIPRFPFSRPARRADPAPDASAAPGPGKPDQTPDLKRPEARHATQPLGRDDITRIAEQVSLLMQLDRTRHHVGTAVDMAALANVPDYLASVFEEAGAVGSLLSNEDLYRQVNKRVAQVEAQIYLMRVELENRHMRDPASIYRDPLVIAAYGERLETLTGISKSFGFDPAVLAHGWYPAEHSEGRAHRWMRPGDVSVACLPHLGTVAQVVEIGGHVLDAAQLDRLEIRAGSARAEILPQKDRPTHFTARFELRAEAVKSANYLPIEFIMTDFRQPNAQDTRLLGINVSRFTCRPLAAAATAAASA